MPPHFNHLQCKAWAEQTKTYVGLDTSSILDETEEQRMNNFVRLDSSGEHIARRFSRAPSLKKTASSIAKARLAADLWYETE